MEKKETLQLRAYENLKQMIQEGSFVPGTIYSETKIARELGISRTPARDAIHRLSQEGYIDVIPSRGFCLHQMTEKDLLDTYQIRCALEGYCVVHLTERAETKPVRKLFQELEELLRTMDQLAIAGDVEEFAINDGEFHKRIVYSLNNTVMSETFDAYHHQMSCQTILSLRTEGRLAQTVREHAAILEGMRSGDIRQSFTATVNHLGQARHLIDLKSEFHAK